MNPRPRILLADDHEMVRRGLRSLIEARGDFDVCGEASTGREAVDMALRMSPDIVIMDMLMPEMNGLDATREIRRVRPDCEVMVLTMHHSEQLVHEVLASGARGYVLKSDAGASINAALSSLARHKPFFTPEVSEVLLTALLAAQKSGPAPGAAQAPLLTPRERELVVLIAEGRSTKEVAARLGISEKTAETHRANLMRKLGIHSVSEIVRFAIRNQMIEA